ncbi:MAG TPA: PIN domain-containing protein [Pseudonocardiaceae bacterium]|nr:PIN domain-containing protein [Pseudonocardiaceae bacterium]
MSVDGALADTSLLIGWEQQRFSSHEMPKTLAVSAVTIGELKLGVLSATDPHIRAARLRTLAKALALNPLPVDDVVSDAWAELRITLRDIGRKLAANDSWIAATALAYQLPLATRDADYDDIPGLNVIKL